MKYKILFTFFGVLLSFQGVFAQTSANKTWLSVAIGSHKYDGDFDNEMPLPNPLDDISTGFGVHRFLNNSFDLSFLSSFGSLDTDFNGAGFNKYFINTNLILSFNFANDVILSEDAFIQPFIGTGAGATYMFGEDKGIKNNIYPHIPITAGLDIPISKGAVLQLKSTYSRTFSDRIDGNNSIDNRDHDDYLIHSVGLRFRLSGSKNKDTDGDGIKDKMDACPDIRGTEAANGCPDNDEDGIINSKDLCPDTPGASANRGCPDSDNDGIVDFEDACPNIAGTTEFKGCADSDGDNIPDTQDTCPNEKGTPETEGCPDDDGDGIKNSADLCPAFAGTTKFDGCPDSDNDGIIDKEDDCPALKGFKPNKGCPEVHAEVRRKLDLIFNNLLFATNSATIDATSLDDLDELVKIMNSDKNLRLSIEGHTDNRGDSASNLKLSRLRAEAVKKHLVNRGINADRIRADGYGETRPVTTNDTAQGRIKNSRVELTLSYK